MAIDKEKLYTTKEAADILRVSVVTVKRYIADNKMPSIKFNGIRRIRGKEILNVLKGRPAESESGDSFAKEQRSWCMSRIRSKDTKPEIIVRKALTELGIRYRLHVSALPGKPDVAVKKLKIAFFINGCFWHQHEGCKRQFMPKSNIDYWREKLKRNVEKQSSDLEELRNLGWKTVIVWECQTKKKNILINELKKYFI